MALEMVHAQRRFSERLNLPLQMRIGINSGMVAAGVIGEHPFTCDLWANALNVASRMESQSMPGRIQISGATRRQLDDRYAVEARGVIDVKGKGPMKTWWPLGRR